MTHDMKHDDMRRNNERMTAGATEAWEQFFA